MYTHTNMTRRLKCIICEREGTPREAHGMDMRYCERCNLMWRETSDVHIEHYESKEVDCSDEKIESRLRNAHDRISLLQSHTNLNNLCDVGCGEGVFLQALNEAGYINTFGIEPSDTITNYTQNHDLQVYKGTIESAQEIILGKNVETISMFHLIEHLHEPHVELQRLFNMLPNGGSVIIETPDLDSYSLKRSEYEHPLVYDEHLFYFSRKSLRLLLENVGFTVFAEGGRDFDVYRMSFKEIFRRFGFGTQVPQRNLTTRTYVHSEIKSDVPHNLVMKLKNILRIFLVKILMKMGRVDYLWMIGKKYNQIN